jgi:hypothetical protein
MGQRRVAGAEDLVAGEVHVELLPEGGPDVDLREDAESLPLEEFAHPDVGLLVGERRVDAEAEGDAGGHCRFLPEVRRRAGRG